MGQSIPELVPEAKALCPQCGRIFQAYCRADDPKRAPLVWTSLFKLRSTCGRPECEEAEWRRVNKKHVAEGLRRYEEACEATRQAEQEKATKAKKIARGLEPLGL